MSTNTEESNNDEENNNQVVFTVTRTYTSPDGQTQTKTFEYFGDEAQKLIREMKERELFEQTQNDKELFCKLEKQFDNIKDPNLWLDNGFKRFLNNTQNVNESGVAIRENFADDCNLFQKKGTTVTKGNQQINNKIPFVKEALDEHNRLRDKHGVISLKLNRDLCKIAQEWSENIANTGSFEHSNNKFMNQNLGENIAMRFTSTGEELNGKQMTDQWYEEASSYNYDLDFQTGKGHFAQIVWKNTREVGFGRAKSKDGKWYAVANYFPAGNYIGQFKANVFPPKN